jgi:hypothetical protein
LEEERNSKKKTKYCLSEQAQNLPPEKTGTLRMKVSLLTSSVDRTYTDVLLPEHFSYLMLVLQE